MSDQAASNLLIRNFWENRMELCRVVISSSRLKSIRLVVFPDCSFFEIHFRMDERSDKSKPSRRNNFYCSLPADEDVMPVTQSLTVEIETTFLH